MLNSRTLLICSGSGMTADCRIPPKIEANSVEDLRLLINGKGNSPVLTPEELKSSLVQVFGSKDHVPILRGTFGLWHHFPAMK